MYTFVGIWGDARTPLDQTREDEASAIRYACWACEDWGKVEVHRDGVAVGIAYIGRDNVARYRSV